MDRAMDGGGDNLAATSQAAQSGGPGPAQPAQEEPAGRRAEQPRTQASLADSEARYRFLAENASDLVSRVDGNGIISWISPSVAALGWDPDRLVGTPLVDLVHPDDVPKVVGFPHGGASGQDVVRLRERGFRDGAPIYHWFRATIRAVTNECDRVIGWVAGWQQIDAEVATAQALAASEERYRLVAENAADVVAGADPTGVLEWVSPSVTRVLGWHPDDLVGRHIMAMLHPDDLQAIRAAQTEINAGAEVGVQARVRTAAGGYRWMHSLIRPLVGPDGRVVGRVAGWRDIQAEHDARDALVAREAQFRLMVEHATDIVFHAVDGITQWVSPSLAAVTGWSPHEAVGASLQRLWHCDDLASMIDLRAALYTGRAGHGLLRVTTASGGHVWLDAAIQPYTEPDGRAGVVGIMRDVSDRVAATEALAESQARFQLLAENASDLVSRADLDGRLQWVSPSIESLGWRPEELVGDTIARVLHPDDVPAIAAVSAAIAAGKAPIMQIRVRERTPRGGKVVYHWFRACVRPICDPTGQVVGRVAGLQLIDAERAALDALSQSEARYRLLAENAADIVFRVRADCVLEWVSPAVREVLGWDPAAVAGRPATEFLHPEDVGDALMAVAGPPRVEPVAIECRAITRDGHYRSLGVRLRNLRDDSGRVVERVGSCRDITAARRDREELQFLANHDSMTRLANRGHAISVLHQMLSHQPRGGTHVGVLFADMDHLKNINDTHGHAAGDAAIIAVAQRIRSALRASDLAARIGGDEFLVVLPGITSPEHAYGVARKLQRSLREPLIWDGKPIVVSLSIGVAVAEPGEDPERVIARADAAAYEKKRGRA